MADWINWIGEWRAQLADWGVTQNLLLVIGTIALVAFIFSLREVVVWFLRVHHLRQEVRALRAQISALQATVDGLAARPTAMEHFLEDTKKKPQFPISP